VSRRHVALSAIVILAGCVRFWGLRFGLPHTQARPDELPVAWLGKNLLSGSLNPEFFDYPSLYLYALGLLDLVYYAWGRAAGWFTSLDHFVSLWPVYWSPFFLIARLLTAVLGTLTVWLVYRVGARLFDATTGLVAALYLALAPLHVRDSHFGVTDVPMTFMVMLGLLMIVREHAGPRPSRTIAAGLVAGLATSTKYTAAALIVPMTASVLMALADAIAASGERARRIWIAGRRFLLFVPALAAGFLIGTPFAIFDQARFARDIDGVRRHTMMAHGGVDLGPGWLYLLTVSLRYGLGLPLLAAGLAGLVLLWWRSWRTAFLLTSFPIACYLVTAMSDTLFFRYVIPLVPFLCLTAAFATVAVAVTAGRLVPPRLRPAIIPLLAIVIIAPSAYASLRTDALLATTDNRLVVAQWVRENVPPHASIYVAASGSAAPQLDGQYEYWSYIEDTKTFERDRSQAEGTPQWIVIVESPLAAYTSTPGSITSLLSQRYDRVGLLRASDPDYPGMVYDRQDNFHLPIHGFGGVTRPGPNVFVYRRRE
jgi:hypothetical protein